MPVLLSQSWKLSSSLALILSVLALFVAFSMSTTPCASAASGSCSVGDLETFSSAITVNEDGNDADTRIEGDTNVNLLYADAGNDRIGIGTASPGSLFDVNGTSTANALVVGSTERVHFDGSTSGDTYLSEESSDDFHIVVGGDNWFQIDQDTDSIGIGLNSDPSAGHIAEFHNAQNLVLTGTAPQGIVVALGGNVTGRTGMTNHLATVAIGGTIATQTATQSIAQIDTLRVQEPNITDNLTGTITRANSLHIVGVPDEGALNNAIYMPSGAFEVSDGQGAAGEQLTSGGVDGNLTWTAAASSRAVKQNVIEHSDSGDALSKFVDANVYDFNYKPTVYETIWSLDDKGQSQSHIQPKKDERYQSTGDYQQTYVGIMADEAPWAMHYDGTILDPISTFGYTVLAIQELESLIRDLEARIAVLEAK